MIAVLEWIAIIALLVTTIAGAIVLGAKLLDRVLDRGQPEAATPTPLPPREYTVYLVAELDPSFDPPCVVHLSTYGCSADQLTRSDANTTRVDVAHGYGDTFEEAREQIMYQLRTYPWLAWAKKWLDEDRGYLSKTQLCEECGTLVPKDPLARVARRALTEEGDS